ncbi:hypothetical protein DFH07DRAFT_786608, partial [Mycena maculata]
MMAISNLAIWFAVPSCVFLASGIVWQITCNSRPKWLKELHTLGEPRSQKLAGTATVCGGSIAGTVTARILADHFARVIIVDPEIQEPDKPKTRIMQYNAAHVFLSLFVYGARRLWPNFDEELLAAGCRLLPADTQFHYSGVLPRTPYQDYPVGGLPTTLVSRRSTAQKLLYRLLMQHPTAANITILAGTVRGVVASEDMRSIQSVVVRRADGTETSLNDAALVADCTGMSQAGLKWLKNSGFSLPGNIRCSYTGNLRYATLCFTVSPELAATLPVPEHTSQTTFVYGNIGHFDYDSSTFGLLKGDNNTMQLVMGNYGDESALPHVASEVVPFLEAVRGHEPIPSWFLETIAILCESGNPSFDNIKIATQSYIQYHLVPEGSLPSNFVAIGDANIQLNPVYGQGFAKIILNNIALNTLLNKIDPKLLQLPRNFSVRYFKDNAVHTNGLWDATRFHDYGFPNCEPMKGETRATGRLARWFELKLISAATQDDEVASALWHVRHLLRAESALMAPTVLWKILCTPSRFQVRFNDTHI